MWRRWQDWGNKQPNKRLGNISDTLRVETAPWWQKLQYKKHLSMWFITSLLRQLRKCSILQTFAKFGFLCFLAHIVKHSFWWSWKPNNVLKTATQSAMFCIVLLIDFLSEGIDYISCFKCTFYQKKIIKIITFIHYSSFIYYQSCRFSFCTANTIYWQFSHLRQRLAGLYIDEAVSKIAKMTE